MAINPGSFVEFSGSLNEADKACAGQLYGEALDIYRAQLAADYGVHLEDLHAMQFPEQRVGNAALIGFANASKTEPLESI